MEINPVIQCTHLVHFLILCLCFSFKSKKKHKNLCTLCRVAKFGKEKLYFYPRRRIAFNNIFFSKIHQRSHVLNSNRAIPFTVALILDHLFSLIGPHLYHD